MRILIACEFSGRVRSAFRAKGFDAYSCDLLPAEDKDLHHLQVDVRKILNNGWDVMIAFPPCTYLCNSGVRWLYEKPERWEKLKESADFFKLLLNAPIPHIAIENPIPHKYAVKLIGRKYDQIIQPYYFGEPYSKATCLWLKNLPPLKPVNILPKKLVKNFICRLPPSPDRWKNRSRTFLGIAKAMAEQWGDFLKNNKEK